MRARLARTIQHEIDHPDGILILLHLSLLKRDLIKRKIRKLVKAEEWERASPGNSGCRGDVDRAARKPWRTKAQRVPRVERRACAARTSGHGQRLGTPHDVRLPRGTGSGALLWAARFHEPTDRFTQVAISGWRCGCSSTPKCTGPANDACG
jgi:hypothetical protein